MSINVARFDLVTIRLTVLCAELGSLSAAAKQAHCSISAGSTRLKVLEGALGRELFVRDYRGLRPTDAGVLFVRHAKAILRELELIGAEFSSANESSYGTACRADYLETLVAISASA